MHEYAPQVAVSNDATPLTATAAAELLRQAGGREITVPDGTQPVTRRVLARMIEQSLDPFAREIDHRGHFIQ